MSESIRYSEFKAVAELFRAWAESLANLSKNAGETSPSLAVYFSGGAWAFEIAWYLCHEQAQTRRDEVGPSDYAPALKEPVVATIKSVAESAAHAYELALDRAAQVSGRNDGEA